MLIVVDIEFYKHREQMIQWIPFLKITWVNLHQVNQVPQVNQVNEKVQFWMRDILVESSASLGSSVPFFCSSTLHTSYENFP